MSRTKPLSPNALKSVEHFLADTVERMPKEFEEIFGSQTGAIAYLGAMLLGAITVTSGAGDRLAHETLDASLSFYHTKLKDIVGEEGEHHVQQ